jgi:transcription antitermination factor NusG
MECANVVDESRAPRWHALHVFPNREKKVAAQLLRRSVEHFLPLYTERSKWSDRSVTLERPLFPGYLFVRFAADLRRIVIAAPGVLRILGNKEDEAVDATEIERIREAIATGCVIRPHRPILEGMRVRVLSGVFAGAEGVVIELRGNCKVIISMTAVRQCYSLETGIGNLEIAGKKMVSPENERLTASGYKHN